MTPLYLSNNKNLGSTARILQCWLTLGRQRGVDGHVVLQGAGDFSSWLAEHDIPHRIDPMPWLDRWWPFPALWHAWKIARWARRARVDLIHCNEHDVYPFGWLLRRFLCRPLVCHVRFRVGREFCEWAFRGDRQPDALLWTSRQQRDDCAQAISGVVPEERQHIAPLGLDLGTFGTLSGGRDATRQGWGVLPDDIVIGTASALRPVKRIEDFIRLVAELARECPRVVGVIAGDAPQGDEPYREAILRQIEQAGLGRRLRWLGNLEPVEPFYHAIDLFVSTSEYETFGNSVCEAMACRRAIAAYRGGSVNEVVGDSGRVVQTGDLDGLIRVARHLVHDAAGRAELGERGRRRVSDVFSPAKTLEQVLDLYRRLCGGGPAATQPAQSFVNQPDTLPGLGPDISGP